MRRRVAPLLFGTILALLGLLWLLQGMGMIHLRPLLCFAECEPITGTSSLWRGVGAVAFAVGVFVIGVGVRRLNSEGPQHR